MNNDSKLIFEAYTLNGLAKGKTVEDVAKKHGVQAKDIEAQIEKGVQIEHEHTGDEQTARKIAMDHVFEDPMYYDKLKKIESKNENAEMPAQDFNKLKQHINKGPISIKKQTKELPYTHKYIHGLAKQDSREIHQDEDAENANTRNWVNIFHRTFGPGYKEEMEKSGQDPYEFFVDYYIAYLKNPEIVNKFAEIYNSKYPTHKVDLERLHKEIDKIKDKPQVGYKAPIK